MKEMWNMVQVVFAALGGALGYFLGDPEKDLSAHHGGGGACAGCPCDEHRIDAQNGGDLFLSEQ